MKENSLCYITCIRAHPPEQIGSESEKDSKLLEDFLIQFQNPLLLQDAVALEGLFMAAESLLSYLVHIESFTSADSRPTSIRHSLGSAIDATIEMAQILERLIYGFL